MKIKVPIDTYYRLCSWFSRGHSALKYMNAAKGDPEYGHVRWVEWSDNEVPELTTQITANIYKGSDAWKYRLVAVAHSSQDLSLD